MPAPAPQQGAPLAAPPAASAPQPLPGTPASPPPACPPHLQGSMQQDQGPREVGGVCPGGGWCGAVAVAHRGNPASSRQQAAAAATMRWGQPQPRAALQVDRQVAANPAPHAALLVHLTLGLQHGCYPDLCLLCPLLERPSRVLLLRLLQCARRSAEACKDRLLGGLLGGPAAAGPDCCHCVSVAPRGCATAS